MSVFEQARIMVKRQQRRRAILTFVIALVITGAVAVSCLFAEDKGFATMRFPPFEFHGPAASDQNPDPRAFLAMRCWLGWWYWWWFEFNH